MYSLVFIDDEKMILNSLVMGHDWQKKSFKVVGTSQNAFEALKIIRLLQPDVVFTDIKMPGISGLELISQAKKVSPRSLFIVISGHADFAYAKQAMDLGVIGYCLKPVEDDEIDRLLTKATDIIEDTQLTSLNAFENMMRFPNTENANIFLQTIFNNNIPEHCTMLLSAGKTLPPIYGIAPHVLFRITENLNLFFILENDSFLDNITFKTSILSAVASKEINALGFMYTEDIVKFLTDNLIPMMDTVLQYFIMPEYVFTGRFHMPTTTSKSIIQENENFDLQASNLIHLLNKNQLVESRLALTELLSVQTKGKLSTAWEIYQSIGLMLNRMNSVDILSDISFFYELPEKYPSFEALGNYLLRLLDIHHGKSINFDTIKNTTFKNIIIYIHDNFTQPISFQEICEKFTINPSYLSQIFKRELGVTFTSYLTSLRIRYAKELLETSGKTVTEISVLSGFGQYFYFTKVFKKETGVTPKQYRDSTTTCNS